MCGVSYEVSFFKLRFIVNGDFGVLSYCFFYNTITKKRVFLTRFDISILYFKSYLVVDFCDIASAIARTLCTYLKGKVAGLIDIKYF